MKTTTLVLAAVLTSAGLWAGCAAGQRAMPGTLSAANTVAVLNTIDKAEIEAAQLAKDRASSPAVREFAGKVIDDHTQSLNSSRDLAQRMNVQPDPPQLASSIKETHKENMETLRQKSGTGFDKTYMEQQIKMHEQALSLVKDAAESTDNPQLRQHLQQMRPDLQGHLQTAKNVQRNIVAQQQ